MNLSFLPHLNGTEQTCHSGVILHISLSTQCEDSPLRRRGRKNLITRRRSEDTERDATTPRGSVLHRDKHPASAQTLHRNNYLNQEGTYDDYQSSQRAMDDHLTSRPRKTGIQTPDRQQKILKSPLGKIPRMVLHAIGTFRGDTEKYIKDFNKIVQNRSILEKTHLVSAQIEAEKYETYWKGSSKNALSNAPSPIPLLCIWTELFAL